MKIYVEKRYIAVEGEDLKDYRIRDKVYELLGSKLDRRWVKVGRIYKGFELRNDGSKIIVVAFIDSGSDNTIISKRAATKLKITTREKEELEVANKDVIQTDVGYVKVTSKEDGIDDKIRVNITDVPFEIDSDENIDMIVGLDFMQEHNVRLKFKKK